MAAQGTIRDRDNASGRNPTDELFDQLQNPVRREILTELVRSEDRDVLTTAEFSESIHSQIALRHVHLPKLAGAGYIEWDSDSNTFTAAPGFRMAEPIVELLIAHREDFPSEW